MLFIFSPQLVQKFLFPDIGFLHLGHKGSVLLILLDERDESFLLSYFFIKKTILILINTIISIAIKIIIMVMNSPYKLFAY